MTLEIQYATSDLRLKFRRYDDLGSMHLKFCLEAYVDADYAPKAEGKRSISGVVV